jgi:hypothetical protein
MSSVRKYLARIGSIGGRRSRRKLDAETARAMVRSRAARRALRAVLAQDRERLCAMTATEKLALVHALWRQAWALAAAGARSRHPDWTEAQVRSAVREVFRRDVP